MARKAWRVTVGLCALACASGALGRDAALDPSSVAGVYKHSFDNGDVEGDRYRSEDILELVTVSPKTVYFRTRLEFFNGHECALSGIADVEGAALVFHDPQADYQGRHCVLRIEKTAAALAFREGDATWTCKNEYCGERGAFEGEDFALRERRTIRYMARLLASQEYREAVSSYAAAHGGAPAH